MLDRTVVIHSAGRAVSHVVLAVGQANTQQDACHGPLSVLLQKSLANSKTFLLFFFRGEVGVDPPPPTPHSDVCTFATKIRS
jgi:hypothetical protein